jgi:hypothetical protein
MGIDVFGIFQIQTERKWHSIQRLYDGQRGYLRAWLGCDFYKGEHPLKVFPISSARGLPSDFDATALVGSASNHSRPEAGAAIGEWGHSWLLDTEILDPSPALAVRQIHVSMQTYLATLEQTEDIELWRASTGLCQEQSMPSLISISYLHPRSSSPDIQVETECIYDISEELCYFKDEVRLLRELHGPVRFVYGFA